MSKIFEDAIKDARKIREIAEQYQAGIEFTSIHINAKEAIKSFIDRIIQGV